MKDDTLESPVVIAEIQVFFQSVFDAIVNGAEQQKVWKSNAEKQLVIKEGGDCGKSS